MTRGGKMRSGHRQDVKVDKKATQIMHGSGATQTNKLECSDRAIASFLSHTLYTARPARVCETNRRRVGLRTLELTMCFRALWPVHRFVAKSVANKRMHEKEQIREAIQRFSLLTNLLLSARKEYWLGESGEIVKSHRQQENVLTLKKICLTIYHRIISVYLLPRGEAVREIDNWQKLRKMSWALRILFQIVSSVKWCYLAGSMSLKHIGEQRSCITENVCNFLTSSILLTYVPLFLVLKQRHIMRTQSWKHWTEKL